MPSDGPVGGNPFDGIPLFKEAIRLHEEANAFAERAAMLGTLAELYLHAGQLDQAEATAREALGFAHRHRERGWEGWIWWVMGMLADRRGDPEAATRDLTTAREIAEELGMRPLVAHCHLGFGRLYRRIGKRQQAGEHFTTATTMYREMDMRFWLEQAEAEMRALA